MRRLTLFTLLTVTLFSFLLAPQALAVTLNPGDIIVAGGGGGFDPGHIIRVDPVTGAQTIILSGQPWRERFSDVAIDAAGNIIVVNMANPGFAEANAYIIRLDPVSGAYAFLFQGLPLNQPSGVAIDAAGNIIVADWAVGVDTLGRGTLSPSIIRVDPVTGALTVISSNGFFGYPVDVAIDAAGNIIVADASGGIIRVDPVTGAQTLISSGGLFGSAYGVAIDAAGNIIVAGGGGIIRVDPVTGAQTAISSGGLFARGVAIVPEAIVPIPEPSSLLLLGSGLVGALGYGVRRFRALRSSR